MDIKDFEKRLAQKLESVLMTDENSGLVAFGFNSGARSMYNLALAVVYEIAAESKKGAN